MVQVIRKKTPYRIENWVCNALSFVSLFGSGLAPFHKRIYLLTILQLHGLDFHFYASSHYTKLTPLTLLTTYLFTQCVTILQYHTAFTILLPTDASPSTPIK